jgi:hypothetical protein
MSGGAQLPEPAASVAILMATYNNGAFLAAQIESIRAQTFTDWHLFIQDDRSGDDTLAVARRCQRLDPTRVTVLENPQNLGAKGNFSRLLAAVDAPYLMLSDGDDVWEPWKVERSLALFRRFEARFGAAEPLLLHTDLAVVDRDLAPIAPSFWRMQGQDPRRSMAFRRNLVANCAAGCTILVNRALRRRATPVPEAAIMHDWWLMLVASAFGHIIYLDQRSVRYRQHGGNAVGAKRWDLARIAAETLGLWRGETRMLRSVERTIMQDRAFLARYGARLPAKLRRAAAGVAWPPYGAFARARHLVAWRLTKPGLLRSLGFLLLFCRWTRDRALPKRIAGSIASVILALTMHAPALSDLRNLP